ncbi:hypothetical protein ACWOA0_07910 [Ignavigranum ruoffiae]
MANLDDIYQLEIGDIFYQWIDEHIIFLQIVQSSKDLIIFRQLGTKILMTDTLEAKLMKPLYNEFISHEIEMRREKFNDLDNKGELIYWEGDYIKV